MAPPVLKSVVREERCNEGYETFRDWVEDQDIIYIGNNGERFVKGMKPSVWVLPKFIKPYAINMIPQYERYQRSKDDLTTLLASLEDKW